MAIPSHATFSWVIEVRNKQTHKFSESFIRPWSDNTAADRGLSAPPLHLQEYNSWQQFTSWISSADLTKCRVGPSRKAGLSRDRILSIPRFRHLQGEECYACLETPGPSFRRWDWIQEEKYKPMFGCLAQKPRRSSSLAKRNEKCTRRRWCQWYVPPTSPKCISWFWILVVLTSKARSSRFGTAEMYARKRTSWTIPSHNRRLGPSGSSCLQR